MSRRGKGRGGPSFVQLHHWLLSSPAWRALSANARCIYIELKGRYDGRNNGLISLSAREAGDAIGSSHHTGNRALTELVEAGFIEVAEQSDFNRKVKIARSYVLTEVPDDRPGRSRIASKAFLRAPQNLKHSLMGEHHSLTHETVSAKTGSKKPEQSHPCDCDPPISVIHSLTHETHIHLSHRRGVPDVNGTAPPRPTGEAV
jgi:hypothetical protein